MDDMDLLRNFRGGMVPDHEAARTAARMRLANTMMSAAPARRVPTKPVRAAVAVAAVLAVAVAVSPLVWSDNGGVPSAAAAELHLAAERAAMVEAPAFAKDGEYAYYRSEILRGFTSEDHLVPRTREIWLGNDGSGRIVESLTGDIIWLGQPDPLVKEEINRSYPRDDFFEPSASLASATDRIGLTPDEMVRLAGNDRAFRSWMDGKLKKSGWPDDIAAYMQVADFLREAVLPSEFRAAVYRYAATIPGVELLGPMTDSAGRDGIGIMKESRGVRYELIFDSNTSALLEEREVVSPENQSGYPGSVGTVLGQTTYFEYGVVASANERP